MRRIYSYLPIFIFLICLSFVSKGIFSKAVLEAASNQKVVKIYSEVLYGIDKKKSVVTLGITGGKDEVKSDVFKGSGFLVLTEDNPLILTAAHVIRGPSPSALKKVGDYKIDGDKVKITYLKYRARISTFSLKPDRIYLDEGNDIALLKITKDKLNLLNLETFDLKDATPKVEDPVRIWGFPGTSVPQFHDKAKVTDVKASYFSLNQTVDPGYSGGPVFSSKGKLLGLVARSSEKQTRCVTISDIQKAVKEFDK